MTGFEFFDLDSYFFDIDSLCRGLTQTLRRANVSDKEAFARLRQTALKIKKAENAPLVMLADKDRPLLFRDGRSTRDGKPLFGGFKDAYIIEYLLNQMEHYNDAWGTSAETEATISFLRHLPPYHLRTGKPLTLSSKKTATELSNAFGDLINKGALDTDKLTWFAAWGRISYSEIPTPFQPIVWKDKPAYLVDAITPLARMERIVKDGNTWAERKEYKLPPETWNAVLFWFRDAENHLLTPYLKQLATQR